MTISINEAKANLSYLYERYLPSHPDLLRTNLGVLDIAATDSAVNVQEVYEYLLSYFTLDVGQYGSAFPGHPVGLAERGGSPSAYDSSIPSGQIVDYYYPNASQADKAAIIQSLDSGLPVSDFLEGWAVVSQISPAPSAKTIIEAATDDNYIPGSPLSFPGVTDSQLDFLTSVYVGSFNRAPEYNGLKYWAVELGDHLKNGMPEHAVFRLIVSTMFKAGAENGEQGSTMSHSAYVTHLYNNVLGRTPDKGGLDYWVNDLSSGVVEREVFLETFLTAALEHKSDASYITARVEVAKFAAQEHISGSNASNINLSTILNGVKDASTAKAAINALIDKFGAVPSKAMSLIASWDAKEIGSFEDLDFQIQEIDMTGISTISSPDLLFA